jgi:antitoxin FitA
MGTLTIRRLDEKIESRLRIRAAAYGRSMEEEAREILRSVLTASPVAYADLADAICRRFSALGGVDLELPRRDAIRGTS